MLKLNRKTWKIILKSFLLSSLLLGNLSYSTAQTPAGTPTKSASETATEIRKGYGSFNVSKYLTVGKDPKQGSNIGTQDQSYLKSSNPIASFILQIINFISLTVASLSFFAIVVGGFILLSSGGNENMVNKGKEIITYAVTGLVITLSSYFIVSFVQNLLFETAAK